MKKEAESWPVLSIDGMPEFVDRGTEDVVMRVSVSYPVNLEQLAPAVSNSSTSLHLTLDSPLPEIVTSEPQLNDYTSVFYETLVSIRKLRPNAQAINVFFSGPPTLAFRFGQQISPTVDSEVIVYNYSSGDSPNYGWALNLRSGEILDLRSEE